MTRATGIAILSACMVIFCLRAGSAAAETGEREPDDLRRLSGTVRDAAGRALEGVQLQIRPYSGDSVLSDSDGKFEITWLHASWVEAGYLPMMTDENDFTWTFWARQAPGQATPANDIIIGNRWGDDNVDTAPREFIKFTPNQFEFHMNGAATGNVQYSPAADSETGVPSNDEWIHHVVVKDGEALVYYRNGEVANQGVVTREMLSANPFPFAMGGQHGVETWQGYLSDVRLFDHSLTAEEIAAIIGGGVRGDYNGNGELDAQDLDWQAEVLLGLRDYEDKYDETGDGQATAADRAYWLAELKKTWVGDSNLDFKFDTADLVQVLGFGKYESGENAGWAEGDWTGNLTFDTGDLVAALGAGGYEQGLYPDDGNVASVPEPNASVLLILGMLGCLCRARRE